MPPSQPAVSPDPNVAAAVASQNAALQQTTSLDAQSGLAAAAPAPISKEDRIGSILKGIAAVAAELGPEFVHSDHGSAWLEAGELALQIVGEVL